MNNEDIKIIAIDLFAGGGGVTTGLSDAMVDGKRGIKVILGINHDPLAIASFAANHPDSAVMIEDIRLVAMSKIIQVIEKARIIYPEAKLLLWASLECTNFSKAKGGLPRQADSRTLALDLYRYVETLMPDYIGIENVVEFKAWGPLDENGKPVSMKAGTDYIKWVDKMKSYGYDYDTRDLNAADYGAYTSRIRFFAQFVKRGDCFAWPLPTHAKKQRRDSFGSFKQWKPVKEVLDLTNEGNDIFQRVKSEKTFERIYSGLLKFVGDKKDDTFITKYYSGKPQYKNISIHGPAATIKTVDGQAIVKACFMQKYNSTGKDGRMDHAVSSIERPCPTITTQNRLGVVNILLHYYKHGFCSSVNLPAPTVRTGDGMAMISCRHFLDKQYGSGKYNVQSVNMPAGSILINPKLALVTTNYIDRNFSQGGRYQSIDRPAGSILSVPKLNLVTVNRFIISTHFNNTNARSVNEPAPTITASRRHHYLVNPQYNAAGSSIDKPAFTLIARMDKRPPLLITANEQDKSEFRLMFWGSDDKLNRTYFITPSGKHVININASDAEYAVKIKIFMAIYGIAAVKIRMLTVDELKLITGFPASYILHGNQSHQKKQIGNAVPTPMARALGEARLMKIKDQKQFKVA